MEKLNNKGFTLVELLAVLVILVAIMGIAIPTISSSLERTKDKQNEARYKILESAAEQYVTDNKNSIYKLVDLNGDGEIKLEDGDGSCYIKLSILSDYLSSDDMEDADGVPLNGGVIFTIPNKFEYSSKSSSELGYSLCETK